MKSITSLLSSVTLQLQSSLEMKISYKNPGIRDDYGMWELYFYFTTSLLHNGARTPSRSDIRAQAFVHLLLCLYTDRYNISIGATCTHILCSSKQPPIQERRNMCTVSLYIPRFLNKPQVMVYSIQAQECLCGSGRYLQFWLPPLVLQYCPSSP